MRFHGVSCCFAANFEMSFLCYFTLLNFMPMLMLFQTMPNNAFLRQILLTQGPTQNFRCSKFRNVVSVLFYAFQFYAHANAFSNYAK